MVSRNCAPNCNPTYQFSILLQSSWAVLLFLSIQQGGSEPSEPSCPEPQIDERDQFVRVGPRSRYLYPKQYSKFPSPNEARQLCLKVGLEPALIESLKDFQHLTNILYYENKNVTDSLLIMNVDGTDQDSRGMFKSFVTNQTLPFQASRLEKDQPYFEEGSNCISLFCGKHVNCHFQPQNCWLATRIMPVCQYSPNASGSCSEKYDLGYQKDELVEISRTEKRIYFGSSNQKSWAEAKEQCFSNGYNLLSFIKEDVQETQAIYSIVKKYQEKYEIPSWMGQSWTSAAFSPTYVKNATFTFTTSPNQVWNYGDNVGHWEWDDSGVQDSSSEVCIVITGHNTTRPVLCGMKNFFLCFKQNSSSSELLTATAAPGIRASEAADSIPHFETGTKTSVTGRALETSGSGPESAGETTNAVPANEEAPHHLVANIISADVTTEGADIVVIVTDSPESSANALIVSNSTTSSGLPDPSSTGTPVTTETPPGFLRNPNHISTGNSASVGTTPGSDTVKDQGRPAGRSFFAVPPPTTTESIQIMTDEAHSSSVEILSLFSTKSTVENSVVSTTASSRSASAEALASLLSKYNSETTAHPHTEVPAAPLQTSQAAHHPPAPLQSQQAHPAAPLQTPQAAPQSPQPKSQHPAPQSQPHPAQQSQPKSQPNTVTQHQTSQIPPSQPKPPTVPQFSQVKTAQSYQPTPPKPPVSQPNIPRPTQPQAPHPPAMPNPPNQQPNTHHSIQSNMPRPPQAVAQPRQPLVSPQSTTQTRYPASPQPPQSAMTQPRQPYMPHPPPQAQQIGTQPRQPVPPQAPQTASQPMLLNQLKALESSLGKQDPGKFGSPKMPFPDLSKIGLPPLSGFPLG